MIDNSKQLRNYYHRHKEIFDRGVFGIHQFYEQMYTQVLAEVKFKREAGVVGSQANLSKALENFLNRYDIPEDLYNWDSAYMQIMRMQRKYPKYLVAS